MMKILELDDAGMVQKLQECKVTKFVSLQVTLTVMEMNITDNSNAHILQYKSQWESAFQNDV